MHLKRWITGIIAVPILIYLIGFGQRWIFYFVIYLVSIIALHEFYDIISETLSGYLKFISYLFSLSLFLVMYRGQIHVALIIISFFSIVSLGVFLFFPRATGEQKTAEISKAVMGIIYVCLPLAMLLPVDRFHLMDYPFKGTWIFFLLAVTFANDTGAFYCGRLFGKHLLFESISPKKTWEGAIGGLIFSIIIGALYLFIFQIHRVNPVIIFLIITLSVMGQIGDLAESMLKRNHGIKDSGKILPGHGGMLDRIDSLLFSISFLYLFLLL